MVTPANFLKCRTLPYGRGSDWRVLLFVYILQIGVPVQSLFIKLQQRTALFIRQPPLTERSLYVAPQQRHQRIALELDVVQHLAYGIALNHRIEHGLARWTQPHVDRVGIAEQIVQVAQNLLIRSQEERPEIIVSAVEGVKFQRALHIATVDERIHLPIGIAGDIAEHRGTRGLLVQLVNRHDREELLDGPTVGHALEERE